MNTSVKSLLKKEFPKPDKQCLYTAVNSLETVCNNAALTFCPYESIPAVKSSTGKYVTSPVIFLVDKIIFSKSKYFHFETFTRKFLIFDQPKTKISIQEHCFKFSIFLTISFYQKCLKI